MTLLEIATWAASVAGALAGTGAAARAAWRVNKRLVAISNAVAELVPNGGTSIKDAVCEIRQDVRRISERVERIERRRSWPW